MMQSCLDVEVINVFVPNSFGFCCLITGGMAGAMWFTSQISKDSRLSMAFRAYIERMLDGFLVLL